MRISSLSLAGVPALVAAAGPADERRGTILLFHGFTADKTVHQREAESLARAGFLAISLDCVGHGERRWPDFDRRFSAGPAGMETMFQEIVVGTAREVPAVVGELRRRGWADRRLGIFGCSMGGFVAYRSVLELSGIRAITPLCASPELRMLRGESPHRHPERFYPVAVLSQNPVDDEVVNPARARRFADRLRPFYAERPERIAHHELTDTGHFLEPEAWEVAWRRILAWFERFVADSDPAGP